MSKKIMSIGAVIGVIALCAIVLAVTMRPASAAPVASANTATTNKPVALPHYDIQVFARGNNAYYNPDSVEVVGQSVYIGYQNTTATDGSDHKTSTIVQYTKDGRAVRTFIVPGHCDGLRYDPYTHMLWSTSNEDANSVLEVINPETGKMVSYNFSKPLHGGGYDDVAFLNGKAFITASNPTLNSAGVNAAPAVSEVVLKHGMVVLTPVLMGNAMATDLVSGQKVQLNLTDPDSSSIDNQGNLVQDSQADSELIFVHNPGTATQTISRLSVGTQVDDTLWIPSKEGRMLVVDGKANVIYAVTIDKSQFTPGTVYTEAPSDSGVAGFVGQLNPKTGTITPVIIGLSSPTGLAFFPNA